MGYGFTIDSETNPLQATDLIIILCWTWNIISFFEHSAPSLHLSLGVMHWRTLHPRGRGAAGLIVDGNFIERRIPTPYQLRSASSYIYLVLLGGKTFRISNARPCIRMLARRIRAVGYLVDVYLFPNNTFESIPPDVLRYIVGIRDTVLIIIPPESLASEYRSDYYADSDSTSTSSGDSSLHL